MDTLTIFDRLTRAATLKRLAEQVGVRYQSVQDWRRNGIPAKRVPAISRLTGIPRHELRPDLWEPPQQQDHAA